MIIFHHLAAVTPCGCRFITFRKVGDVDANQTYEADSVPDTPMSEAEGAHLLAMIRGCEPDDFILETEA